MNDDEVVDEAAEALRKFLRWKAAHRKGRDPSYSGRTADDILSEHARSREHYSRLATRTLKRVEGSA